MNGVQVTFQRELDVITTKWVFLAIMFFHDEIVYKDYINVKTNFQLFTFQW